MPNDTIDAELFKDALDDRLLDLHTAMPGMVVSYNPLTKCADVQPAIKRALKTDDDDVVHEELPVIHNVPIEWTGGGGFAMQFPVRRGDNVWLIFSEAATTRWRTTGQISEPGDLSRHSLSYAMALCVRGTVANVGTPLAPPNEARMDCPAPFVFADGATGQAMAQFVANATLVTAALEALKTAISSAPTTPNDGGSSFKAALVSALSEWPPTVAATKLKAE